MQKKGTFLKAIKPILQSCAYKFDCPYSNALNPILIPTEHHLAESDLLLRSIEVI